DPSVGDEPLDRPPGHFAAVRIEAREDDRARRVVDDQVDAGGELEGADVAALAADDAPLHVVARQIDDGDGGLDGVVGGAALDRLRDDAARALAGVLAVLALDALDERLALARGVSFHRADERLLRLVLREAADALEIAPLAR